MKLFEDIELRLSDLYQQRKRLADRYESVYFINEAQIFSYDLALEHFKESVQAEYDKLCPKPSEFPDGYEWYTIDADGQALFRATEPKISCNCWINLTPKMFYKKDIKLPLGVDWRLCRWSIQDAKRIHGEDKE